MVKTNEHLVVNPFVCQNGLIPVQPDNLPGWRPFWEWRLEFYRQ
jgi:hypothetical protein